MEHQEHIYLRQINSALVLATVPDNRTIRGKVRNLIHRAMDSRISPTIDHQRNINYELINQVEVLQSGFDTLSSLVHEIEASCQRNENLTATISRIVAELRKDSDSGLQQ